MNRKILFDVETTGFYFDKDDKIVEIALLEIFDDKSVGKEIHYYLNPQRDIPEETTKIHGITNEKVKDCPIFKDVAEEIVKFIGDSELIAHNSRFDAGFLNKELGAVSASVYDDSRFIDTLKIAQKNFPNQRNSLDALCKRFGISLESRENNHGALIDTRLLSQVYIKLTEGQKNMFDEMALEGYHKSGELFASYQAVSFIYRNNSITEEEESEHKVFISKIKNPTW